MLNYRIYNKFSTNISDIYDENERKIGTIQKYYDNFFEQALDTIFGGSFINKYRIFDNNGSIIFKSRRDNPMKWRKYFATYYGNNETHEFCLKQKDFAKISDNTDFIFENETYDMTKQVTQWAVIKNSISGKEVARWKINLSAPLSASFETLDNSFVGKELMLIGLFHTFYYGD